MFSKVLMVAALLLGATANSCVPGDPGDPNGAGKAKHVVGHIGDGTTLEKKNYGMWKATDGASEACWWAVTVKGKVAAKGGKHDAVMSFPGVKGGTLHTNCGLFYK